MTAIAVHPEARHALEHGTERQELESMLRFVVVAGASDLHLSADVAPTMRLDGGLIRLPGHEPLTPADLTPMLRTVVDEQHWRQLLHDHELDVAFELPEVGRFRVNMYRQRGTLGAVFRAIPARIPGLEQLGLPPQVAGFAELPRGLVLVTGPTGSGKTTTLAALLARANQLRSAHLVTIEDPIEFVHEHGFGLVSQREVGSDTGSFATALRQALRQDPDIVLVGELRDLETTATALTAAETGHLVFATLHTQSAAQTVDRIVDMFPGHQQPEIRSQLSTTLQAVVSQALVPRAQGHGRALVAEVLIATPAVRSLIRDGRTHQLPSVLQAGAKDGMLSFDQDLARLVREQVVTHEAALRLAQSVDEYSRLLRGI